MNRLHKIVAGTSMLACLAAGSFALAHDNGHECRTVADCEKLPGTAKEGERAGCLACIGLKEKHHWHPDYPAGDRCRLDNGKP
jgi:hypothetical protein